MPIRLEVFDPPVMLCQIIFVDPAGSLLQAILPCRSMTIE